jgi:hypothetical protein
MLFLLCGGITIGMVEGNHRMFYCCMKLFGRHVPTKDTPFPYANDSYRINHRSGFFHHLKCDVILHKASAGIPIDALHYVSQWYQKKAKLEMEGRFLTALDSFVTQHEDAMLSMDEAMEYVVSLEKRKQCEKNMVKYCNTLFNLIVSPQSQFEVRQITASLTWEESLREEYMSQLI